VCRVLERRSWNAAGWTRSASPPLIAGEGALGAPCRANSTWTGWTTSCATPTTPGSRTARSTPAGSSTNSGSRATEQWLRLGRPRGRGAGARRGERSHRREPARRPIADERRRLPPPRLAGRRRDVGARLRALPRPDRHRREGVPPDGRPRPPRRAPGSGPRARRTDRAPRPLQAGGVGRVSGCAGGHRRRRPRRGRARPNARSPRRSGSIATRSSWTCPPVPG